MHTFSRMVRDTLARWDKEAAMHVCSMMRQGGEAYTYVTPTGLKLVRVSLGRDEKADVNPVVFEQLQANGWTYRDPE
ncbi:MAG: hypothetical protein FGM22_10845 [Burkholderiaceae bacterium]|nr:hypothetical protein [Burkholderiaceae bacterium]